MAANDYYGDAASKPYHGAYESQTHPPHSTPSPAPSSYPPSYTTQPPHDQQFGQAQHHPPFPGASPFATDFDDHVHPSDGFARDTHYHGSGTPSMSHDDSTDNIPLRHSDGVTKPSETAAAAALAHMDTNDHVYDNEPGSGRARGLANKARGRLRYGELGMALGSRRRIPLLVYFFSIVQVAVFIAELVKMAQLTGSPIQTKPAFNVMIGPSSYVLINMGSRYVICMHEVPAVQNVTLWSCPNSTSTDYLDPSNHCSLSELCGFGGVGDPPNQWWRFITPIFMHAGFIHIGFNLLLQLTLAREIEQVIGSIRFFLVYMSSGIFGFVMGGNYAATGISSTGASGSLFGIIALTLIDLIYSWKERRNPVRELMFIIIETLVSFVLGLLPGLDNFSHIGGFLMGLCLGVCVLHSPNVLREKIGDDHFSRPSYSSVNNGDIRSAAFPPFHRNPVGFFKGRKGLWWAWWIVRAAFLVTIIVVFILLLNNFYTGRNTCSWCKYLSCLPVKDWCEVNNIQVQNVSTNKRSLDDGLAQLSRFL